MATKTEREAERLRADWLNGGKTTFEMVADAQAKVVAEAQAERDRPRDLTSAIQQRLDRQGQR